MDADGEPRRPELDRPTTLLRSGGCHHGGRAFRLGDQRQHTRTEFSLLAVTEVDERDLLVPSLQRQRAEHDIEIGLSRHTASVASVALVGMALCATLDAMATEFFEIESSLSPGRRSQWSST